jgi:hypothetical protein
VVLWDGDSLRAAWQSTVLSVKALSLQCECAFLFGQLHSQLHNQLYSQSCSLSGAAICAASSRLASCTASGAARAAQRSTEKAWFATGGGEQARSGSKTEDLHFSTETRMSFFWSSLAQRLLQQFFSLRSTFLHLHSQSALLFYLLAYVSV